MTLLIDKLREDMNTARKARDSSRVTILSTLLGEISQKPKTDGIKDTDVIASIKKTIKGLDEVISLRPDDSVNQRLEKNILEGYLPVQATEDEIEAAIAKIFWGGVTVKGKILAQLKIDLNGNYAGKLAAEIVDKFITAHPV